MRTEAPRRRVARGAKGSTVGASVWRFALVVIIASAVGGSWSGCVPAQVVDDPLNPQNVAKPLDFEDHVKGRLDRRRERYLVKVSKAGLLHVDLSWNDQEGLDRVQIQSAQTGDVETIDGRNLLEIERRLPVTPGFYYLELVPGERSMSYDLVVVFEVRTR